MSSSEIADPALNEAAELLQQQLIYNGEVLDIAFESLRSYKAGTQSLAYLDSSVYLAYALLRMLERWGKAKSGEMYVRKNKPKKKKNTKGPRINLSDPPTNYLSLNRQRRWRGRWYTRCRRGGGRAGGSRARDHVHLRGFRDGESFPVCCQFFNDSWNANHRNSPMRKLHTRY
jgi:hypothetical protein